MDLTFPDQKNQIHFLNGLADQIGHVVQTVGFSFHKFGCRNGSVDKDLAGVGIVAQDKFFIRPKEADFMTAGNIAAANGMNTDFLHRSGRFGHRLS